MPDTPKPPPSDSPETTEPTHDNLIGDKDVLKATRPLENVRWDMAKVFKSEDERQSQSKRAHQEFIERSQPPNLDWVAARPDRRALRKLEELVVREEALRSGASAQLPPHSSHLQTTLEKLWKLTDSNLFWGGGIGLALAAYAFEWSSAPPKLTVVLLAIAWAFISISICRHKFFERYSRAFQIVLTVFVCGLVASILVVSWFLLIPQRVSIAPSLEVKIEKPTRSHIHVSEYRFSQTLPRRANLTLVLQNTGILDASVQVYYQIDFKRIPDSDLEMSRLEDDLYARLTTYMAETKAVTNIIPTGGERISEAIPTHLTDTQRRTWNTGKYAIYYIGEIKYQDSTGERASRFCLVAKSNGDVLSCRRYNEEQ